MKVIKCQNNNLSRPSFGMQVDFHADDMRTQGVKLPNYDLMRETLQLTNADPKVKALLPDVAYLKHVCSRLVPRKIWGIKVGEHIVDHWELVANDLRSNGFEISRNKPKLAIVEQLLLDAARIIADRYGERMYRISKSLPKTGRAVVV